MSSDIEYGFEQLESDELLALARFDMENARLDGALFKLKRLLRAGQPPAEAISMAARLYAQLKLFDRAESLFKQYLEFDSEAITERFQLGMSLYDSGKQEAALLEWDQVLVRQPYFPPALFYKAITHAGLGEIERARTILDELLRRIPADNLYFSRAHDLLKELSADNSSTAASGDIDTLLNVDKDAYKTIQ